VLPLKLSMAFRCFMLDQVILFLQGCVMVEMGDEKLLGFLVVLGGKGVIQKGIAEVIDKDSLVTMFQCTLEDFAFMLVAI